MYKYEVYISDRYIENGDIKIINDWDSIIDSIANYLITSFNLTGISIRDEEGYYKSKSGDINSMKNKVLYFFSDCICDSAFESYCKDLKFKLKQESLLINCNGGIKLC